MPLSFTIQLREDYQFPSKCEERFGYFDKFAKAYKNFVLQQQPKKKKNSQKNKRNAPKKIVKLSFTEIVGEMFIIKETHS